MKSLLSIALAASLLSPIKLMSEEQNYTFKEVVTEALDDVRIRNNKLDDFLREITHQGMHLIGRVILLQSLFIIQNLTN